MTGILGWFLKNDILKTLDENKKALILRDVITVNKAFRSEKICWFTYRQQIFIEYSIQQILPSMVCASGTGHYTGRRWTQSPPHGATLGAADSKIFV